MISRTKNRSIRDPAAECHGTLAGVFETPQDMADVADCVSRQKWPDVEREAWVRKTGCRCGFRRPTAGLGPGIRHSETPNQRPFQIGWIGAFPIIWAGE